MKLPGGFWEHPLVLPLVVFPCGFVAGLLVAPVLYLLTYGDFWKSLGSTLIGFTTVGVLLGSLFGVTDLFIDWAGQRPRRRPRIPAPKFPIRRASSTRAAA